MSLAFSPGVAGEIWISMIFRLSAFMPSSSGSVLEFCRRGGAPDAGVSRCKRNEAGESWKRSGIPEGGLLGLSDISASRVECLDILTIKE